MLQEYTLEINLKLAFQGPYSLNIFFLFYLLVACVISKTCHQRQTDSNRYKLYITYVQINFLFGFYFTFY